MLATNVQGLLYVTRAALPHLARAAESGPRRVADLVNISSTAGRVARPGNAVYSLTKFGVNARLSPARPGRSNDSSHRTSRTRTPTSSPATGEQAW